MIYHLHQEKWVQLKLLSTGLVTEKHLVLDFSIYLLTSDMFNTLDVADWSAHFHIVDIPDLKFIFSGIFGHILMLQFDLNTTIAIAEPFMGKRHLT